MLLTVRDESSLEMLGEDYPYYGEGGLEGVLAMVDRARATFGGPDWKRALDRLRDVRGKTRIERIAREYADFFRDLE